MTLISKKAVCLAKEEGTYGVDPTLAAGSNAFEVISDLTITPIGNLLTRSPFGNTISQAQPLLGSRWVEVSFVTELKGSGTAATAPRGVGDMFEACGMNEAVTTTVTYTPESSSFKSVALEIFIDGIKHQILGCRGTFKLLFIVGETAKIEWNFMGKYTIPTDVAIPSPTYDSTVPPTVLGASYTWNSDANASVIQQLEMDLANVIAARDSLNDATGIAGFEVVGREPKGSMNPETNVLGTYDFFTEWTASTERAITITIGSASGNKYVITAPKVVIESIGYGDRNGIRVFEIPIRFAKSSGDDEISIVHST